MTARHIIGMLVVGALVLGYLFWFLMTSSGCAGTHIAYSHSLDIRSAATPTPAVDGYEMLNDRSAATTQ